MNTLFRIASGALLFGAALSLTPDLPKAAAGSQEPIQQAAFEKLKSLAGDWKAVANEDSKVVVPHRFEVVSGGATVMETLFAGTDHSMINMYYLDGGELRVTHYCSMGNQPEMKLNPKASTPTELVFDFVGGRNIDPDVDAHVHSARISFPAEDRVEASWEAYDNGKPAGRNLLSLTRKR